jgi:hypothetical protein
MRVALAAHTRVAFLQTLPRPVPISTSIKPPAAVSYAKVLLTPNANQKIAWVRFGSAFALIGYAIVRAVVFTRGDIASVLAAIAVVAHALLQTTIGVIVVYGEWDLCFSRIFRPLISLALAAVLVVADLAFATHNFEAPAQTVVDPLLASTLLGVFVFARSTQKGNAIEQQIVNDASNVVVWFLWVLAIPLVARMRDAVVVLWVCSQVCMTGLQILSFFIRPRSVWFASAEFASAVLNVATREYAIACMH